MELHSPWNKSIYDYFRKNFRNILKVVFQLVFACCVCSWMKSSMRFHWSFDPNVVAYSCHAGSTSWTQLDPNSARSNMMTIWRVFEIYFFPKKAWKSWIMKERGLMFPRNMSFGSSWLFVILVTFLLAFTG